MSGFGMIYNIVPYNKQKNTEIVRQITETEISNVQISETKSFLDLPL